MKLFSSIMTLLLCLAGPLWSENMFVSFFDQAKLNQYLSDQKAKEMEREKLRLQKERARLQEELRKRQELAKKRSTVKIEEPVSVPTPDPQPRNAALFNPFAGNNAPAAPVVAAPVAPKLPEFTLQGIVWASGSDKAIIDGQVYGIGQTVVEGVELVDIDQAGVTVLFSGQNHRVAIPKLNVSVEAFGSSGSVENSLGPVTGILDRDAQGAPGVSPVSRIMELVLEE